MSVSIAMVTLGDDPKISVADVLHDLQTTWPGLSPTEPTEKDGNFTFSVGTAVVAMGQMPVPIPWSELEGPCRTSSVFPDAEAVLKPHTQHLIVTVLDAATPLENARLLTQVTAAVLGTCKAATGVYWGAASLVIRADVFRGFAVKVLAKGPPLDVWIDFRVGPNPDSTSWGFTVGLDAFGLMELETRNASETPRALRERLVSIADYLIASGPVIRDGDTVGENANEKIRVQYGNSTFGRSMRVMHLDYGSAGHEPKRPRWKLR